MRYGIAAMILVILLTAPALCSAYSDASASYNILFPDDGRDGIEIDFNGKNISTDGGFSFSAHSAVYDLYNGGIAIYAYTDSGMKTDEPIDGLVESFGKDPNNPSYVYYELSRITRDIVIYFIDTVEDSTIDNGLKPETHFNPEKNPETIYVPDEGREDPGTPDTTPSERPVNIDTGTTVGMIAVLLALVFTVVCIRQYRGLSDIITEERV